MDELIPFFGRLLWWQRPLVLALPLLLAALILPMLYNGVLKPSIDILRGKYPKKIAKPDGSTWPTVQVYWPSLLG